jgi:hypothetical protein
MFTKIIYIIQREERKLSGGKHSLQARRNMKMNKRGQGLGMLMPAALTLCVAIIAISIGAQVLGTVQDTQTADSAGYNVTDAGLDAVEDFSDWFTTIVVVVAAVIVIGLVLLIGRRRF